MCELKVIEKLDDMVWLYAVIRELQEEIPHKKPYSATTQPREEGGEKLRMT